MTRQKTAVKLVVCIALCSILRADSTVIIDIDAKSQNAADNAEDAFFEPGTYKVVPVGIAAGGEFDAWQTDSADPGSWVNAYTIVSEEFSAFTTSDRVTHDSAGEALGRAMNTMFSLEDGGPVRFYLDDDTPENNEGGMSLRITLANAFVRGDANTDGLINVVDADLILRHVFQGAPITCRDAADGDDNDRVNIADAIGLMGWAFRNTFPPREPFPECGPDSRDGSSDCESYPPCE